MNENEKICPLISTPTSPLETCKLGKCQFWTTVYTTEGMDYSNCALVIMAMKNEQGKIPV